MKKIWITVVICLAVCACSGSDKSLFQRARLAQSKGNYTEALSLYTKLLKQNPEFIPALTNRGLMWEMAPAKDAAERTKNQQFAQQDYLRALELDPNQPETYNNLGALYLDQKQYGNAIAYLSEALVRRPRYFRARVNRGIAYSKVGDLDSALTDFEAAGALRPHDISLLLARGLAYMDLGQYEAAADCLSHAIAFDRDNARLYLERARAFTKMGYPADAYDDLTEAINLQPTYALAYYYLGELMFQNGDTDYALGALVKAKELAQNYVPAYDLMGDMLSMQDPVAATANYLVALKLDPQHAAKYNAKIEMMKTEEGRYRVLSNRFFPQGRAYDSNGTPRRFTRRPGDSPVQTAAAQRRAGKR